MIRTQKHQIYTIKEMKIAKIKMIKKNILGWGKSF